MHHRVIIDDDLIMSRMEIGAIEHVLGFRREALRQHSASHAEQIADRDLFPLRIALPFRNEIRCWLIDRLDMAFHNCTANEQSSDRLCHRL